MDRQLLSQAKYAAWTSPRSPLRRVPLEEAAGRKGHAGGLRLPDRAGARPVQAHLEPHLPPLVAPPDELLAGEGVHELVGEDQGAPLRLLQGLLDLVVPAHAGPEAGEPLLLPGAEGRGDVDQVIAEADAAQGAQVLEDVEGQVAVAAADLDDVPAASPEAAAPDPMGDGLADRLGDGGSGGEIPPAADLPDVARVVAPGGIIQGRPHEFGDRDRAPVGREGEGAHFRSSSPPTAV